MGTAPSQPVSLAGTKPATLALSGISTSVDLITGAMYDYDSVVAALAPVFNSGWGTEENSKPLYFSQGVPFQMVSTRMILSGTGDWNQWQWRETKLNKAEKQQLGITQDRYTDPGPVITLQHFWDNDSKSCQKGSRASITVKQGSPTAPTFTFVKYTPKPGEYPDVPAGKSIILLHVVQPGHGFPNGPCDVTTKGYVTVPDNYDANLAFGATINASLAECVAAKVRFGVVWRTDAAGKTSIMLYYASSTFPLGPQPRVMSIIPGWDKYYRQPSFGDHAFTASNYIFFGIWRPDTPDAGPSYITASPYNWTYDPATMMITLNDSVWNSQQWELLQFELKYIVTTEGMEAYMNTYCSGTTTACTNTQDAPTCTMFMATGELGDTCRTAALLNVAASEHFKQNICGIDWRDKSVFAKPPREQDVEALNTPDCACINYEQSTFKQKTLANLDFAGYSEWMTRHGITPISSSGYCWWPSCTNAGSSLKAPSLTPPISECPNVTQCINSINQAAVSENSTLTINTKNACGGSGNSGTGEGTQGSSTGGTETTTGGKTTTTYNQPPLTPSTSGAGAGGGNDGITSQKWFYPVVIFVAVLVVLALAWYFMHNKNKKPAA